MNPSTLSKAKQRLESEKNIIKEQISRLEKTGMDNTMSDSLGELSVYDNHPADIGDELFERSKDTALIDNAHVILSKIELALEKIDNGSYGYCDKCGKPIPMERLNTIPWVSQCITCQKNSESVDVTPRPLEEESLEPPFHRTFLDSAKFDFVGFDGEDALQAVLKYGSSDSPQDIPGSYNYKALFPNSNEHAGIVEPSDAIPSQDNSAIPKENKKSHRSHQSR